MRTEVYVHRQSFALDRGREHGAHISVGPLAVCDRRLPREQTQLPALVLICAQGRRVRRELGRIVAPHNDRAIHVSRILMPLKRHHINSRKPFGGFRRLELALIAKQHRGWKRRDVSLAKDRQLTLIRQFAVASDQAGHRVDLRVINSGGEPDTANRHAERGGDLNHGGARSTRHIGVVENDPRCRPTAGAGARAADAQCAARLIAIQALKAIGDELFCQRGFAGGGQTHRPVQAPRRNERRRGSGRIGCATFGHARTVRPAHADRPRRAGCDARVLPTARSRRGSRRDRHDDVGEVFEPCERDLEGRGFVA